jgi:hypothetical protein
MATIPRSPLNPLFVRMLRVYGFAFPTLPLRDQVTCASCGPDPGSHEVLSIEAPAHGGRPWSQTVGFILWFTACILAYVADCLQTKFWGYHLHPMVVMCVWPLLYMAAQRQLTLLASYRKALDLMGAMDTANRCCEPQCCQTGGCCGICSCCGCPCGKAPDASGASERLLADTSNDSGEDKGPSQSPPAISLQNTEPFRLLTTKAQRMLILLRYRWTLGLGLLGYIAVVGCVIGVFGVNFVGQVFGGRLPADASSSVKLAVLCHGFLGSLNYGMLGPSIAAWVGSTWALMYCHKLQCWDWEEAVAGYKEGATEVTLRAGKEVVEAPGTPAHVSMGELSASSESEARFVDSAIAAYTALREDLQASHGIVSQPFYIFLVVLVVLMGLGFRDSVLATLPIAHFGQSAWLVLAPIIALIILYPLINLSITLDKVIKSFADKKFSWGALSLNSRVFISIHIDKNPLFYDANISSCLAPALRSPQNPRRASIPPPAARALSPFPQTQTLTQSLPQHADMKAMYGLLGTAAGSGVAVIYPLVFPKG